MITVGQLYVSGSLRRAIVLVLCVNDQDVKIVMRDDKFFCIMCWSKNDFEKVIRGGIWRLQQ